MLSTAVEIISWCKVGQLWQILGHREPTTLDMHYKSLTLLRSLQEMFPPGAAQERHGSSVGAAYERRGTTWKHEGESKDR